MKLIGINGFKTSGKDTAYQIIKEITEGSANLEAYPNERVERRAFADILKIMAAKALGFDGDDEELIATMDDFKETGTITHQHTFSARFMGKGPAEEYNTQATISGRKYLQLFGEKGREVFGETFWVDQVVPLDADAFKSVWETLGRRQPNSSVVGLPAIGCVTDARYENEAERVLNLDGVVLEIVRPGIESDGHSSEKPLPPGHITYRIVNDGTMDDFRSKISYFLESI